MENKNLYSLSGFLAFLFLLLGCGLRAPTAERSTRFGGNFDHTGIVNNCASCHDTGKPFVAFPTSGHPDRRSNDCSSCHTTSSWKSLGGSFSHSPTPTSCASCHGAGQAYADQPVGTINKMNHAVSGLPDCVSCHADGAGVSWTGAVFPHSPTPQSCNLCHDPQRPVGLVGNPPFDHADGGTGDCVSCHAQNAGRTWVTSQFNHTPTPGQCASCHLSERPQGIINKMYHSHPGIGDCVACHADFAGVRWAGAVFKHSPTPTSCQDCHGPQRPTGLVGNPPFNHAVAGTGDCKSCHAQNAGQTWTTGQYNHTPRPTSCSPCHASERPTTVINKMNHAHSGIGDCVGCHTQNVGSAWAPGVFSHTPAPTTCQDCHAAQRPSSPVGNPPFNHSQGGTGDCKTCHLSPGVTWAGGVYAAHSPSLTSCFGCHGPTNTKTATLMATSASYQMNHSYGSILTTGSPDCFSCHGQANGFTSWAVGDRVANTSTPAVFTTFKTFHANIGTQPTTCLVCHTTQKPAGTVPDKRQGFDHATRYGTECASCHRNVPGNVGKSWKAPYFNHMNNSAANLGTCSTCHDNREHKAGELCTRCHRNVVYPTAAPTNIKGWTGGSWGDG